MTLPTDHLIDRWRLSRKLSFWRWATAGVVLVALAVAGWRVAGSSAGSHFTAHIARLSISGVIVGDEATLKLIREIADQPRASGVILKIESPGGTTTGSEILYDELRRLAAKKPVVAEVGTIAASGAYIAALGADQIIAHGNSLVGSIGVLFQYPNVSKLLDKIGVEVETVKSSPLKAAPSGFEPTSEAAKQALAALVADSFTWFKGLVQERRHLNDAELAAVADGRVFTGRQSVANKLIDRLGGEREAVAWLESKGVAKDLPIRDWERPDTKGVLGLFTTAASVAQALGFDSLATLATRIDKLANGTIVDGLLSIWQG